MDICLAPTMHCWALVWLDLNTSNQWHEPQDRQPCLSSFPPTHLLYRGQGGSWFEIASQLVWYIDSFTLVYSHLNIPNDKRMCGLVRCVTHGTGWRRLVEKWRWKFGWLGIMHAGLKHHRWRLQFVDSIKPSGRSSWVPKRDHVSTKLHRQHLHVYRAATM